MKNTDPVNEQNDNKVPLAAKVDPAIFRAVASLAVQDDRSVSNMVERLLKQSPLVAERLEAETIGAAAS